MGGLSVQRCLLLFSLAFVIACSALIVSCGAPLKVAYRGAIVASDGQVVAESLEDGSRVYPAGRNASTVVGSCYVSGAPEGIEQRFEEELLSGQDITLTLNMRIQEAAVRALGERVGAVVVLDPESGAVLAMASTPSYDPSVPSVPDDAVDNRATELHVPGSTFKTVTLACALEQGAASLEDRLDAPPELSFEDGTLTNYGYQRYGVQTLDEAYATSTNTVFAQLALDIGIDAIAQEASAFGFDDNLMDDFPVATSSVLNRDKMTPLAQAWAGVGQAVFDDAAVLQGPVMTPVQGAVMAAAVINEGVASRPFIVQRIGDVQSERVSLDSSKQAISQHVADELADCMRRAIRYGTGRGAQVLDVDVGGKTGTAETVNGTDDGWFIGFAQKDERRFALSVMVEDAESAEATDVAADVIRGLFALE